MPVRYLCSLPNPGSGGVPHELFYPDDELGRERAEQFAQRENKPGRGIYDCIATLADGAKSRRKETVAELDCVITDLDLKNIVKPREEVLQCLRGLLLPPSEIRDSGFGVHAVWRLKEPVNDEAGLAQAEDIMRHLAGLLAGDPAPAHRCTLLRRVGTTNSKNGEARPCYVIEAGGQQYDITEFSAMLDLYGDRPRLTRHQEETKEEPTADAGHKGPVDIDARLAAMKFGGAGDSTINKTRLHVCSAMLARGIGVDEIVRVVMDATRACVANNPGCSNWRWAAADRGTGKSEEQLIWESCFGFIVKHPDRLGDRLPDKLQEQLAAILAAGKRPQLTRNNFGWYLRGVGAADTAALSKRGIIRQMLLRGTTADEVRKAIGWKSISLPQQAKMLGLTLTKYEEGGQAKYKAEPASSEQPQSSAPGGKQTLRLRPFVPIDIATLPPRTWLYGKHYQRRTVSLTAGPGGMGKSSLDLVEAIAMATCRNLLGEQPEERIRCWYHNGEDPLIEINRRIVAICEHYKIEQSELESYLFVTSGNEFPLRVAKGYNDLKVDHDLVRQISDAISENQIDLATFDPLVTLHSVSEVDSGKMDTVIRLFAGIGDENDCGIEIAHHVRKPTAGTNGDHDYSVHDIRGVAAITDAVRAARVLNRMSEKDGEAAGCTDTERAARFRVDRAKGNYSPPQAATWRQFINVELANGDEVGVVAPWDFPGQGKETPEKVAIGRAAEHVFVTLLNKYLTRGQNVSPNVGPTYAPSKFAEEPEAALAKIPKAALRAAMNRLLDTGRIRIEASGRGDRHSRLVMGKLV